MQTVAFNGRKLECKNLDIVIKKDELIDEIQFTIQGIDATNGEIELVGYDIRSDVSLIKDGDAWTWRVFKTIIRDVGPIYGTVKLYGENGVQFQSYMFQINVTSVAERVVNDYDQKNLKMKTTKEWNASYLILRNGEAALELTSNAALLMKIGDGTHRWFELPYFVGEDTASQVKDLAAVNRINGSLVDKMEGMPSIVSIGEGLSLSENGVLKSTGSSNIRLGTGDGALAQKNELDESVIPFATGELAGIVRSSDEVNKIVVQDDGTMTIKAIAVVGMALEGKAESEPGLVQILIK